MHPKSRFALAAFLAGTVFSSASAQFRDQTVTAIQSTQQSGGDVSGQVAQQALLEAEPAVQPGMEYLKELALKPVAFEEDLVRVVARFAKLNPDWGANASPEAAAPGDQGWIGVLVSRLRQERILGPKDAIVPGQHLRRGTAALLFARTLGLGGGISGNLFGISRRTTYNELAEMRIIAGGGEHHRMSGAELIELADNAFEYQQHKGTK